MFWNNFFKTAGEISLIVLVFYIINKVDTYLYFKKIDKEIDKDDRYVG